MQTPLEISSVVFKPILIRAVVALAFGLTTVFVAEPGLTWMKVMFALYLAFSGSAMWEYLRRDPVPVAMRSPLSLAAAAWMLGVIVLLFLGSPAAVGVAAGAALVLGGVAELVAWARHRREFIPARDQLWTGLVGLLSGGGVVVAPGLLAAAVEHGGLAAGVAALRSTGTPGSLVAGLDGGMVRLTGRLVEALREDGATVLRGVRVAALSRVPATGGWWAQISDRDDEVVRGLDVDRVVLAVDGVTAWDLLAPLSAEALDPDAGPALGEGIALATLVVEAAGLDDAPRGTGVLVGAGTDVAAKALTHATAKWAWLREVVARPQEDGVARHPHRHVLRLSYGRQGGGPEALGHRSADEELLAQALVDTATLTGVPLAEEDVVARTVTRWRRSIPPQAGPDRAKADTLIDWARDVPGLDLVGSWVHGTGLAAVVAGVDRTLGADAPPAG